MSTQADWAQFEKLWGDMMALSEIGSRFVVVPRRLRGTCRVARRLGSVTIGITGEGNLDSHQ